MVNRRYCAVPGCRSSSKRSPFKAFFSVPLEIEERKKWLQAMCRSPSDFSDKSHLDICEDHFNLEEDLENYVRFKYNGGRTKMKKGVVPHIFQKMPLPHDDLISSEKSLGPKRTRQPTLEDILIANKLLKEFEDEVADGLLKFPSNLQVPFEVYDSSKEKEAAESLLLLSCSTMNC